MCHTAAAHSDFYKTTLLPAGYYAKQVQGWEAFADDVCHVCHLWQAAAKRHNSPFAEQLRAKGVPEMGDIILSSLESLMTQSEASLSSGGSDGAASWKSVPLMHLIIAGCPGILLAAHASAILQSMGVHDGALRGSPQ